MSWTSRGMTWLCACALGAAACDDGQQASAELARAEAAKAKPVAPDPDLADALGQAMAASARERAPGWEKVDKLWRGQLSSHDKQSFLAVLVYGHCYRFLGVGGQGVMDLDLVLFDPNNVELQRDVTQDATPVLGTDVSLCPVNPGAYRIEARMREGAGSFALGLYRDVAQ